VISKTLGILGGMGPESTAALFSLIVRNTPAQKDQDHIRIIIDNNPQIPSRVDAIAGAGPSPLEELEQSLRNLERCHVDLICIPCNLVHYYYDDLQRMTSVPILHMIEECARYVGQHLNHVKKLGLMAALPTIESGLYKKAFAKVGVEIAAPDQEAQERITQCIYGPKGIKSGYISRHKRTLSEIAQGMIQSGAQAVIAGCTEIGLVLGNLRGAPIIDPLEILAKVAIQKCKCKSPKAC